MSGWSLGSSGIRNCNRLLLGPAGPFLIAAGAILLFHGLASPGEQLSPPPSPGTEIACGVDAVLDGDTVDLSCPDGRLRLRLWGIDAPERHQSPWGQRATDHLKSLVGDAKLAVRVVETDVYNRAVGFVVDDGEDVGLRMVVDGLATVRTRYVRDQEYRDARTQARHKKLGIWSRPGLHQRPWEWRRLNPR